MNKEIDVVLNPNDYATMPKYQLQEQALAGDEKAERIYFERYHEGKVDTVSGKALGIPEIQADWIED